LNRGSDTILRISPSRAEVLVEQEENGVISRKSIAPDTLAQCLLSSRYDDEVHATGFLPEGCFAAVMAPKHTWYFIRYPELYADISYCGTEYPHFPLPRLVFGFQYLIREKKVVKSCLCVVKDERLTPETPLFIYPFSNVHGDSSICLGNNALPVYKDPARLHTLAAYILRFPNNNDLYSRSHNKLDLEYRDLLEQLKGKEPSVYYTGVLKEKRQTLKDFLNIARR
jgi:hypothetical protein